MDKTNFSSIQKLYFRCGNTYAFTFEDACNQNYVNTTCENVVQVDIDRAYIETTRELRKAQ